MQMANFDGNVKLIPEIYFLYVDRNVLFLLFQSISLLPNNLFQYRIALSRSKDRHASILIASGSLLRSRYLLVHRNAFCYSIFLLESGCRGYLHMSLCMTAPRLLFDFVLWFKSLGVAFHTFLTPPVFSFFLRSCTVSVSASSISHSSAFHTRIRTILI